MMKATIALLTVSVVVLFLVFMAIAQQPTQRVYHCDPNVDAHPRGAAIYVETGDAYAGLGDDVAAIANFTCAIRLDPTDTEAYAKRTDAYLRTGHYSLVEANASGQRRESLSR